MSAPKGHAGFWGFVWQGADYEGLTCNALEWQVSHGGGRVIEPDARITVNNPQTARALQRAARWVGTISPRGVTAYREEDARNLWQSGQAAFMRSWPQAYGMGNVADSAVKGSFRRDPVAHRRGASRGDPGGLATGRLPPLHASPGSHRVRALHVEREGPVPACAGRPRTYQTLQEIQRAQRRAAHTLPATALLTLLSAIALGLAVTRSIAGPLGRLGVGVRALASGDFQHQVPVTGQDEMAGLATVFNDIASRLRGLYAALRESEVHATGAPPRAAAGGRATPAEGQRRRDRPPAGLDHRNPASLGLQLVGTLAAQLEGTLTRGGGPGATFEPRFRELERRDHREMEHGLGVRSHGSGS